MTKYQSIAMEDTEFFNATERFKVSSDRKRVLSGVRFRAVSNKRETTMVREFLKDTAHDRYTQEWYEWALHFENQNLADLRGYRARAAKRFHAESHDWAKDAISRKLSEVDTHISAQRELIRVMEQAYRIRFS